MLGLHQRTKPQRWSLRQRNFQTKHTEKVADSSENSGTSYNYKFQQAEFKDMYIEITKKLVNDEC